MTIEVWRLLPLALAIEKIDAYPQADEIDAAKARGLMVGYNARWRDAPWLAESLEAQYSLPIVNIETGRQSRRFRQGGKCDGVVIWQDGRRYLLEHKTTSDDIADPGATYWRRLAIDSQVSAYVLAHWQQGRKLDGTLYDVIRKPTIRPKQIPQAERRAIASLGTYCGERVSAETIAEVVAGRENENGELYTIRLAADTLARPDYYFQRRTVPRMDDELREWAGELWNVADDIGTARRTHRHYRNSGACVMYGSPCEYLGLCSGEDSEDSGRWQRAAHVHDELAAEPDSDGRDLITASRVRCFQTCRRKHYYRYEQGLRRAKDEISEALFFGSLMHVALEAWWSCFLQKG